MKGIYLSQEAKKAIEAKIVELESREINRDNSAYIYYTKKAYQNILSTAVVLPVEKDWDDTIPDGTPWVDTLITLGVSYPNGVIIEPKNKGSHS
jgi:hypothetical protein